MHRGNEDDRRGLKARVLTDHLSQLKTIHDWHTHIHQDDGHVVFQQLFKGFLGRDGLDEVFSQIIQNGFIAQQLGGLVVHHENVDSVTWGHFHFSLLSIDAATYVKPPAVVRCSPVLPGIQTRPPPNISRGRLSWLWRSKR